MVNPSTSKWQCVILCCVFVWLAAWCKGLEPWSKPQMWKLSWQGRPRTSLLMSLIPEAPAWLNHLQYGWKDYSSPGLHKSVSTLRWCDKGYGTLWIGKKAWKKTFENVLTMPLGFSPPPDFVYFSILSSLRGGVTEDCNLMIYGSNCNHYTWLVRKRVNQNYRN